MGCCSEASGVINDRKHREWFPVRYQLALTASLGFMIGYMVRFNLSVAMVAMVNTTQASDTNTSSDDCPNPANSSDSPEQIVGEFDWSPELQGTILASFFYGYAITQFPGGWLAGRFGGKWLVGGSVLGMSVLTLLTPLAARLDVGFLLVVRITMGLLGGVMFPGMHAMLGKWSPVFERSKMAAITYAGPNLGVVLAFPLTGVLCQYGFDGGWPSVFYVIGSIGCVWFLMWCYVASNTPADHPRISQTERDLIHQSIGRFVSKQTMAVPWRAMLTSGPIWAILVAGTCCTWGYYTLLTGLPTYLKDVLKLDISQNGILSGIPYMALFVSYMGSGFLADYIRSRGYLNTTRTRKLMVVIGSVGTVAGFIAISFVGCDHTAVISLVAGAVALGGFYGASTDVNNIDLAPNYAGVLMGIINTIQNLAGIIAPLIVGVIIDKQQNRETWGRVFYIAAGIYAFGMLFYCVFGSGALQPWATPPGVQQTVNCEKSGERTPLINEGKTLIQDKKFPNT